MLAREGIQRVVARVHHPLTLGSCAAAPAQGSGPGGAPGPRLRSRGLAADLRLMREHPAAERRSTFRPRVGHGEPFLHGGVGALPRGAARPPMRPPATPTQVLVAARVRASASRALRAASACRFGGDRAHTLAGPLFLSVGDQRGSRVNRDLAVWCPPATRNGIGDGSAFWLSPRARTLYTGWSAVFPSGLRAGGSPPVYAGRIGGGPTTDSAGSLAAGGGKVRPHQPGGGTR